ncbi:NAD-dependent epimerase/dehydratase family protein [Saccharopolyspora sp. NPDC000359]|uniref:NAD-dependent epimerase/dehydratase family protein n=1 Tax=Saccharopolyspora sp. NPDC000359 TaxID=3154251 RepID=UPI0033217679
MRILVLGGTVFVGHAVAAAALERGHEVVCAARGTSGDVPDGAELVVVDRDQGLAALAGERFDAVVDVARDYQWVREALDVLGTAGHWTFVSTITSTPTTKLPVSALTARCWRRSPTPPTPARPSPTAASRWPARTRCGRRWATARSWCGRA